MGIVPQSQISKALFNSLSNSLLMTREYFGAEAIVEDYQRQISRIKIISKPSRSKKVVQGRKWNVLHKIDSCVMWEGRKGLEL